MDENEIGTQIVDCAVHIHRELGPGLLESVYETLLAHALRKRGLVVERQVGVPFRYDGHTFDEGFRADLLVEKRVFVELKSIERIAPVHSKQLLTYLKLSDLRLGYLLNFGADLMKHGIVRLINGQF